MARRTLDDPVWEVGDVVEYGDGGEIFIVSAETIKQAAAEHKVIIACQRLDEVPEWVPGSVVKLCMGCATKIWLAPSSQEYVANVDTPPTMACMKCITAALDKVNQDCGRK